MKIWNRKNRKFAWIFYSRHLHSMYLIEVRMSNLMWVHSGGSRNFRHWGKNVEVQITKRLKLSCPHNFVPTCSLWGLLPNILPHYSILNLLFGAFSWTPCRLFPPCFEKTTNQLGNIMSGSHIEWREGKCMHSSLNGSASVYRW